LVYKYTFNGRGPQTTTFVVIINTAYICISMHTRLFWDITTEIYSEGFITLQSLQNISIDMESLIRTSLAERNVSSFLPICP